jgi:hypothetical protein
MGVRNPALLPLLLMKKILPCPDLVTSVRLLALVGLGFLVVNPLAAAPQFSEYAVWSAGEDGYAAHFVYGIGVTSKDTILVGTEGRASGDDGGNKDLLVKRSTNLGQTWSSDIVVEGTGSTYGYGQPTFVVDGPTIYLFYNGTNPTQHLYYRISTDDGVTWSARTDVTPLWSGNLHGWTVNGPIGHGIKKLKGAFKDTLYVAITHRTSDTTNATTAQYGVDVIMKDPDSPTWEIAGETPMSLAKGPGEPAIAERENGDLFIVARNVWGSATDPHSRSSSTGGANAWGNWVNTTSSGLIGSSQVSGGLLRFSDKYHLFSYPNNPGTTPPVRAKMSIGYSLDGGINWQTPKLVYNGMSTYSDLARDSLGNIYCLYGRDGDSHNVGGYVSIAKFNLEWVTGVAKSTVVVDNTDPGFSVAGSWSTSSTTDGYYGTNYRWSSAGSTSTTARWSPSIPATGNYEVYMRWPALSNRPNAVPIKVVYDGGVNTATPAAINEQTGGGTWQFIGVYNMNAGSGNYVEISAGDAGSTIADAVMFQQQ